MKTTVTTNDELMNNYYINTIIIIPIIFDKNNKNMTNIF